MRGRVETNLEIRTLSEEEINLFREDYQEKEREIQRNIGIYLSGLALIIGWLIGPQTKPLIKMALDNDGYNLFGFLTVVILNVIFTCFLVYKSLLVHEIMQFVAVHTERDNSINLWEAWRRSSQSATKNGGIRVIYNIFVLTLLPLFVSVGILVPLYLLLYHGEPSRLAEQLKYIETISSAAPQVISTTPDAGQIIYVFSLVKYFFWSVLALHLFPLWFFYQNVRPINRRWSVINAKRVPPESYSDLNKVLDGVKLPETPVLAAKDVTKAKIKPPANKLKSDSRVRS